MESSQDVRRLIGELSTAVWAFSVVTAALEAGLFDALTEPRTAADVGTRTGLSEALVIRLLAVLATLELVRCDGDTFVVQSGVRQLLEGRARSALLAEVRSTYLQSRHFLEAAKQGTLATGWLHTDPEILEAQGVASAATVGWFASRLFPELDGLVAHLSGPTARFLDVGAGVAAISIDMARRWPQLGVVALEPREAPLAEARRNVAAAGLEERVELRRQRVEELTDRAAFDLAWLPPMFLPADVVARAMGPVLESLRPGGWALLAAMVPPGDGLRPELARLRNVLWGGEPLVAEQLACILTEGGFDAVQILPGPTGHELELRPVVGRRPA